MNIHVIINEGIARVVTRAFSGFSAQLGKIRHFQGLKIIGSSSAEQFDRN